MLSLACDQIVTRLLEDNDLIVYIVLVGGMLLGGLSIVGAMIRSVVVNRAREITKRELAAYVAEGSLDPDQAVAMLEAGTRKGCSS